MKLTLTLPCNEAGAGLRADRRLCENIAPMLDLLNPFPVAWTPEERARLQAIFSRLTRTEPYFEGHVARACFYALNFGKWLGLAGDEIRKLYRATFFHDIGKVEVPVDILTKSGPLTGEEFKIVQAHPLEGEKLCLSFSGLAEVAPLVGAHHEKLDGSGYPRGLKGDQVHFLARILAIFEIYDALRSERCYKAPFSLERSMEILFAHAGAGQIDPSLLADFQRFGELNDCGSSNPFVRLTGRSEADRETAEPSAGQVPPRQPAMVLVAEDHDDQRALCEIILQKAGYRIIAVNNGRKALEKLQEEPIDIALLDIMMPGLSGIEVCRRIREDRRSIYVIFLTALARGEDRVKGLESGADDYITKPFYHRELLARVSVGERLIAQRRELERLAGLDPLTELYNRRLFEERFAEEFERAKRYGRALSFLILDLDNFKGVNDEYGHQQGDAVIKALARIMREKTRRGDILARYGGEEFTLILPEVDAAAAEVAAEKIRKEVKAVRFEAKPGKSFSVTVSVGAASFKEGNYADSSELFRAADKALYTAKTAGKDRVVAASGSEGRK